VSAAGRTAQVAYLALLDRPDWDAAVLAGVPAPLQPAVRGNTAAGRELRAMTTQPPTTVPAWRIVEPLPTSRLRSTRRARWRMPCSRHPPPGMPWLERDGDPMLFHHHRLHRPRVLTSQPRRLIPKSPLRLPPSQSSPSLR